MPQEPEGPAAAMAAEAPPLRFGRRAGASNTIHAPANAPKKAFLGCSDLQALHRAKANLTKSGLDPASKAGLGRGDGRIARGALRQHLA